MKNQTDRFALMGVVVVAGIAALGWMHQGEPQITPEISGRATYGATTLPARTAGTPLTPPVPRWSDIRTINAAAPSAERARTVVPSTAPRRSDRSPVRRVVVVPATNRNRDAAQPVAHESPRAVEQPAQAERTVARNEPRIDTDDEAITQPSTAGSPAPVRAAKRDSKMRSLAIVAGTAAAGAAVGGIAGGGKGAVIGAISGAAGGYIFDRTRFDQVSPYRSPNFLGN